MMCQVLVTNNHLSSLIRFHSSPGFFFHYFALGQKLLIVVLQVLNCGRFLPLVLHEPLNILDIYPLFPMI